MSDENEIEFEGGFFDEAEVNANDVADDPFGFGNNFWPIRIIECKKPKVTANGDKIGMQIVWAVEHPKYDGHPVSKQLGMGNWQRLPVPVSLRSRIPWNPQGEPKDQQVLTDLKDLYKALGIPADEMGKQNEKTLVGKICSAKIKPKKNDEGFWKFNLVAYRVFDPESDGGDEFTSSGTHNPGGKTADELAAEELARELGE